MMDQSDLMARLADVIRAVFPGQAGEVTRATTSHDVPGWDSVAHVTLMLDVEEAFGIELDPTRAMALADVGDLADLVAETLAAPPA